MQTMKNNFKFNLQKRFSEKAKEAEEIKAELSVLYGDKTAADFDKFARVLSVETAATYLDVMHEAKRLMNLTQNSIESAKFICKQYKVEPNDYITWEERSAIIDILNIFNKE